MTGTTCGKCLYCRTDLSTDADAGMCLKLPKHPTVNIENTACPFYENLNVSQIAQKHDYNAVNTINEETEIKIANQEYYENHAEMNHRLEMIESGDLPWQREIVTILRNIEDRIL